MFCSLYVWEFDNDDDDDGDDECVLDNGSNKGNKQVCSYCYSLVGDEVFIFFCLWGYKIILICN